MATALTTIFGTEIKAYLQPRQVAREFNAFAGAHGLTSMLLGTRGRRLVITGTLRAASRPLLVAAVAAIEPYLWADAADYSYGAETYASVVFDSFQLVAGYEGKAFHLTAEGYVICSFICYARSLL